MIGSDPVPLQLTTNRSGKSRRRAGSDGTDLHALRHRNRSGNLGSAGCTVAELMFNVGAPSPRRPFRIERDGGVITCRDGAELDPCRHGYRHRDIGSGAPVCPEFALAVITPGVTRAISGNCVAIV